MDLTPGCLAVVINSGDDPFLSDNLGGIVRVIRRQNSGWACEPLSRLTGLALTQSRARTYQAIDPSDDGWEIYFDSASLAPLASEQDSIAVDETILWAGFPGQQRQRPANSALPAPYQWIDPRINPSDNKPFASWQHISEALERALDKLQMDKRLGKFIKPRPHQN